jgi:hypothetical protein
MLAHKVSCLLPKGLTAAKTVTHTRSLSAIAAATPSPLSPSPLSPQQPQAHNLTRIRTYVSRAHPKPIPEFSVPTGLQMVLDGTEERKKLRAAKWEQNKDKRRSKGIEVSELRFLANVKLQIANQIIYVCYCAIVSFRYQLFLTLPTGGFYLENRMICHK